MANGNVIPAQIRAARALLDWSQEKLATEASVGISTIRDIEATKRGAEAGSIAQVVRALENGGVEFRPAEGDYGAGVRLLALEPNIIQRPVRMESEVLPFTIEWRGKRMRVCVARHALDDLARGNPHTDAEYLLCFDKYRRQILNAAAAAVDADRVTPDGRVYLTNDDFVERRPPHDSIPVTCPLCAASASRRMFNGGVASLINCAACGVYAISNWAEGEMRHSLHKNSIRSHLPQFQGKSGWIPYVRRGEGVNFQLEAAPLR